MTVMLKNSFPQFECRKFLTSGPRDNVDARMVLFPFVGGSAAVYNHWLADFPASMEVLSVQLPGHGSRFAEALCRHMDEIVDDLIASLCALADKPFFFFGHSLGGRIAYACCKRMHQMGYPLPQKVFISASKSPDTQIDRLLCELNDTDLIAELSKHGGLPDILLENPVSLEYYMPLIRADMALFEHYHCDPSKPLPTQLSLLSGDQDGFLALHQLYGWTRYFHVMTESRVFSGGHFYINDERPALIHFLTNCIQVALERHKGTSNTGVKND